MKTRKSAFAGNTVSLIDGGADLLYPRYTDPVEVLLNPGAGANGIRSAQQQVDKKRKAVLQFAPVVPAAAAAVAQEAPVVDATVVPPPVAVQQADGEAAPQKTRKKARWTDEQKEAAAKERKEKKQEQVAAKKEKKEKKAQELAVRALAPEERISGPGNAEEALKIRETLGFVAPTEGKPAQASPGTFAFVFPSGAPPPAPAAAAPAPALAAAPAAQLEVKHEEKAPSEEDNSSDDDDAIDANAVEVKEEEDNEAGDDSSSSDEDEDSDDDSTSDDSSSSSSSSSDEDEPATKPAVPTNTTSTGTGNAALTTTAAVALAIGESEYVPRRVYVGGMPYSYTENDVREYWEYCGAVESMDILSFPDTGRFRGIAFVTFATEEGYVAALACDGEGCDGQTLKVQKCKWSAKDRQAAARLGQNFPAAAVVAQPTQNHQAAFPPPQQYQQVEDAQQQQQQVPTPSAVVAAIKSPAPKTAGYDVAYVGNVAYEADEAALKALFEPYGLLKVRLHTDKDTGRSKGYAHVHFKDEASLDSAMALDGTNVMGRKIRVGYAQRKKE